MSSTSQVDLHEWADVAERSVLVLNYTMTCPLACSFCCYGCHPKRREKMPLELAKHLISQAANLPAFSSVGFTGGEIFSYEDEFLELSEHLASVKLPFTFATAAHWGEDPTHADFLAKRLVRNGLRRANISCDIAHVEFVPKRSVVNAAIALAQENIPVYVVGTFPDPYTQMDEFLPELANQRNIRLITKRIARVGRGRKLPIDNSDLRKGERLLTCYRRIHHDIVVFWDGRTYPCCSTFNRATTGLCVGNAFQESLEDIWNRVESSSLFRVMKRQGFARFYEVIHSYDPDLASKLPNPANFDGACSLCNALFSDGQTAAEVRAVFAQYETDQLFEAASRIKETFGEDLVAHFSKMNVNRATQQEGAHG